ncbi:SMI1/KNR4 family protein [Commensalibacter communis]|uniref:SMI1/KNR4 family protein n=1 Tax=Commensalibacter communis TaxID=2972786 RepID=UPI0022FF9587|nr:SMI1/KNR4 family protein [Commensalibacter communis]CAI3945708.1 Cell wall assembly regulator SMI1 (Killer toxin-resistance protein 4) (SMI1) (PDB:5J1B) [Commensalibacter communis]CAI3945886.1 Cell wall assembly regulator SMI1 (Killer toxin-resistance protein 4) (SMI1) (PDB:5J1B) [Commensalibacter communis]
MSLVTDYINGLKEHFTAEDTKSFHKVRSASIDDINKLKAAYPLCPDSLIDFLSIVDGTYHRDYGDGDTVCVYMLGSDVYEYPYYLLSVKDMLQERKKKDRSIREIYLGNDEESEDVLEEFVEVDPRINTRVPFNKHLCFSHCMNNGGTSKLYIDFNPTKAGKVGQIIRYLHDPDSYVIIANSFDDYLQEIINNDFEFMIEEDE